MSGFWPVMSVCLSYQLLKSTRANGSLVLSARFLNAKTDTTLLCTNTNKTYHCKHYYPTESVGNLGECTRYSILARCCRLQRALAANDTSKFHTLKIQMFRPISSANGRAYKSPTVDTVALESKSDFTACSGGNVREHRSYGLE